MNDVTLPICESTVLIDPDLFKIFLSQDWADVHLQCRSMMIYTSGFVVSFQFTNMSIIAVLLIRLVVLVNRLQKGFRYCHQRVWRHLASSRVRLLFQGTDPNQSRRNHDSHRG